MHMRLSPETRENLPIPNYTASQWQNSGFLPIKVSKTYFKNKSCSLCSQKVIWSFYFNFQTLSQNWSTAKWNVKSTEKNGRMDVCIVNDYTEVRLKEENKPEDLGSDPSAILLSRPRAFNNLPLILVLQKQSDMTSEFQPATLYILNFGHIQTSSLLVMLLQVNRF